MKDSEFIELLNLYLDHEISAPDAARLEAEVLQNPARRRIYQDYCRMQKACKILAQDFVEESAPAPANVVAFEGARRSSRMGWIAAGTFAAAAACVAFVFVGGRNRAPTESATAPAFAARDNVSIPAQAVAANADRTLPRTVSVRESRDDHPVLATTLTLGGNKQPQPSPLFVGADAQAPQFAWMETVQLAPVQRTALDDFRFEGRAPLRNDAPAPVRRPPGQGPVEWNAFRWQK